MDYRQPREVDMSDSNNYPDSYSSPSSESGENVLVLNTQAGKTGLCKKLRTSTCLEILCSCQ